MLFWHKDGPIDQWKRIESPEKNLHIYALLTFNKGSKILQHRKDFKKEKWFWENWKSICKNMKLDLYLTPYTKINFK